MVRTIITINTTNNVNTDANRVADDRRVALIRIPKIKNSIISMNLADQRISKCFSYKRRTAVLIQMAVLIFMPI